MENQNVSNVQQLLPISNNGDGKQTVSALALYKFLGLNVSNWKRWHKSNIETNAYAEEGKDWTGFVIMTNGNQTRDFEITIDFAKKLAMAAKTDKGEEVRQYFLKCEAIAQQKASMPERVTPPATTLQLIAQMAQTMDAELSKVNSRIDEIEAKTTTSPNYYAICGYAAKVGRKIDLKLAAQLGRKASALCNTLGYIMGTVPDPRFGKVRTYPKDALDAVFNEFFGSSGLKIARD